MDHTEESGAGLVAGWSYRGVGVWVGWCCCCFGLCLFFFNQKKQKTKENCDSNKTNLPKTKILKQNSSLFFWKYPPGILTYPHLNGTPTSAAGWFQTGYGLVVVEQWNGWSAWSLYGVGCWQESCMELDVETLGEKPEKRVFFFKETTLCCQFSKKGRWIRVLLVVDFSSSWWNVAWNVRGVFFVLRVWIVCGRWSGGPLFFIGCRWERAFFVWFVWLPRWFFFGSRKDSWCSSENHSGRGWVPGNWPYIYWIYSGVIELPIFWGSNSTKVYIV